VNSDAYVIVQERMFRSEKLNQQAKFELDGSISVCCGNEKIFNWELIVKNDKSLLKALIGNNVKKESADLYRIDFDFQNEASINHNHAGHIAIAKYNTVDSFRPMILKAKTSLKMVSNTRVRIAVNMVFNVQHFPYHLHNVKIILALASVLDKFPPSATPCQDKTNSGTFDNSKKYTSWDIESLDPKSAATLEIYMDFQCSEGEEFLVSPTIAPLPVSFKAEYNEILLSGTEINTQSQILVKKKTFIEYRFL
jgi:hypothetical protein